MKATMAGMDWDVCDPLSGGQRAAPRITINLDHNTLSLTGGAMELAGNPSMARVLYSVEHNSIALRPTSDMRDNAVFNISRTKLVNGAGGMMTVGDLCARLRAKRLSGSLSVPVEWHPDGLLWGDLTMATKRPGKAKGGAA